MPIKLEISAETVSEFDSLLSRFVTPGAPTAPVARGSTAEEADAPLTSAAKGSRKSKTETQTTAPDATTTGSTTKPEELALAPDGSPAQNAPASSEAETHPLLVERTLADVKEVGSTVVGKLGAKTVTDLLAAQFNVKAFGALNATDFGRCYAALAALL
jgi:hypothetical protein